MCERTHVHGPISLRMAIAAIDFELFGSGKMCLGQRPFKYIISHLRPFKYIISHLKSGGATSFQVYHISSTSFQVYHISSQVGWGNVLSSISYLIYVLSSISYLISSRGVWILLMANTSLFFSYLFLRKGPQERASSNFSYGFFIFFFF